MKGKQIDINSYRKLKWEDIKDDVDHLSTFIKNILLMFYYSHYNTYN